MLGDRATARHILSDWESNMTQSKRHSKTGSSRAKRRAMLLAWLVSSVCAVPLRNAAADSPCEGSSLPDSGEKSTGAWVSSLAPLRAIGLRYAHASVRETPNRTENPTECSGMPTACADNGSSALATPPQVSLGLQEPPRLFASSSSPGGAMPPLPPMRGAASPPNEVSHAVASQAPTGVILASGNATPIDEAKVSIRIGEPAKGNANPPSMTRSEEREQAVNAGPSTAAMPPRMPQQIKPQAIRTQSKSTGNPTQRSAPAMAPPANLNVTRVDGITEHSPVRLSFADDKVTAAPMPRSVNGYAVMRNGSEIPVAVRPIEPGSKVLQSVKSSNPPLVSAIPPVTEHHEAAKSETGTSNSDAFATSQVTLPSETTVTPELESKPSVNVGFVPPSRAKESLPVARPAIVTPVEMQHVAAEQPRSSAMNGSATLAAEESNGIAAHRPDPVVPPLWANPPVLPMPTAPSAPALAVSEPKETAVDAQANRDPSRTKITLAAGPSTPIVRVRAVPGDSIDSQWGDDPSTTSNRDLHSGAHPSDTQSVREEQRRVPVLVGAAPPTLEVDESAIANRETTRTDAIEDEPDAPPAFTREAVDEELMDEADAPSKNQATLQLRQGNTTTDSAVPLPKGPSLTSGPLESGVVPEAAPRLEVESHTANEFLVEGKITNIHIEDPSVCRVLASNGRVFLVGDRSGETVVAMRTAETIEPIYVRVAVVAAWRNPRLGVTDMEQLRATIANLAPQSNLRIQPQPDGSLWVSGMVDSNEQAKRIMELTRRLVLVPVVDKLEVR